MQSSGKSAGRRWSALAASAVVVIAAGFSVVALSAAAAVSKSVTLGVAKAKLSGPSGHRREPIAVTSKGLAVYELSPETARRPLCTMINGCLSVWPPVKVGSGHLRKESGVKGHLGTFRRDGFTQLTLNGHPLYTFVADGAQKGVATGDGLRSFGGVWHVFAEGRLVKGSGAPTAPQTTSSGNTAPLGY